MMVYSVYDSEFSEYGFIAEGYPLHGLRAALGILKLPDENGYVPREETLHAAPDAETCGDRIFADMPYQCGYCGGVPAKVDVMRFHSGPQFSLGTGDFLLLLAKRQEIENGVIDAAKVKIFRVPAEVPVVLYGDTLRSLPRSCNGDESIRILDALLFATNSHLNHLQPMNQQDDMLVARNAWQAKLSEPVYLED